MKKLIIKTTENNITQKLYIEETIYTYIKDSAVSEKESIESLYETIMRDILNLLDKTPKFLKAITEYISMVKPEMLSKRFTEQALHLLDIDEHAYTEAVKQAIYYTTIALLKEGDIQMLASLDIVDKLNVCEENNFISNKELKTFVKLFSKDSNIDFSEVADKALGFLINNHPYFREKEVSEENITTDIESILESKYNVLNNKEIATYLIKLIAEEEKISEENKITLLLTVKEILEENEELVHKILDKNCSKEEVKEDTP